MKRFKLLVTLGISLFFLLLYFFCSPATPDFDLVKRPLIDFNGRIFHPEDSTLILGEKYFLYVKMKTGSKPFLYIWKKDGTAIDSTTGDTLDMTLTKTSVGLWRVFVSNSYGKDSSVVYPIKDTALFSPKLLDSGKIQRIGKPMLDSNLSFYIKARGADTMRFQWYKRTGHADSALSGKTDSILSFKLVTLDDNGYYYITCTNNWGTQTSLFDSIRVMESDTIKPAIQLLQPDNGSTVSDFLVVIKAKVTDASGVGLVFIKGDTVMSADSIYRKQIKLVIGPNTFYIKAEDKSKNKNRDSLKVILTYDSTAIDSIPPTITLQSPLNNSTVSASIIQLKVKITDPSGISLVMIKGDTVPSLDSIFIKNVKLIKGLNSFFITAVDNSKKKNKDSLEVKLTYDSTAEDGEPPIIELISPTKKIDTLSDPLVSVKAKIKDKSGVLLVTIRGDTVTSADSIFSSNIKLNIGPNAFYIKAVDNSPKKNADSLRLNLTCDPTMNDTVAPQITPVTPQNNSTTGNSSITVTVRVVDENGVAWVTINGDTVQSPENDTYTKTGVSLVTGTNTITIKAQDKSSHKNIRTFSLAVTYDPTLLDIIKPVITLVSPSKDTTVKSTTLAMDIRIQATDASGIAKVTMNGDSAAGSGGIYARTILLQPGQNRIIVTAEDASSNKNKAVDTLVVSANRKPVFKDSFPVPSYLIKELDSVQFQLRATDADNDPVSFALGATNLPGNLPTLINGNFKWKSSLQDSGSYHVFVFAIDSLDTTQFKVDIAVGNVNIPPRITVTGSKNGQPISISSGATIQVKEAAQLRCTVTVSDANSDDKLFILPTVNTPSSSSFDTAGGKGRFAYTPAFAVSDGNSNTTFPDLIFYAEDNGNPVAKDSFKITIQVLDSNSAPVWKSQTAWRNAREGSPVTFGVDSVFLKDNEGDIVSFSASKGTIDQSSRLWSWTPGFGSHNSPDSAITFTATDNHVQPAHSDFILKLDIADSTPADTLAELGATYNSIKISWTQSRDPDFTMYKVYYSTNPNVTELLGTWVETDSSIGKTNTTIGGLADNTTYYVRVFVHNKYLSVAGSNEISKKTLSVNVPTITITSPSPISNDSSFITQADPVIRGTASSNLGILKTITATIDNNEVTANGLASWSFGVSTTVDMLKKWHTIAITVSDSAGKSATDTFKTFLRPTLATPDKPVLSNPTSKSITSTWTAIAQCDRYLVYRSSNGVTGNYVLVKDTAGTGFTDNSLLIGKEYWYKIRGYYTVAGGSFSRDSTPFSTPSNMSTKNWFEKQYSPSSDLNYNPFGICQTPDKRYIIAGETKTQFGIANFLFAKISESGDSLSNKYSTLQNSASQVRLSPSNNVLAVGSTAAFFSQFSLLKTDENGDTASGAGWNKNFVFIGNSDFNRGDCINFYNGNYYISGYASDSIILLKTDANGNNPVSKQYLSAKWTVVNQTSSTVASTSPFDIYIASIIIDSAGKYQIGLLDVNSTGGMEWAKTISLSGSGIGKKCAIRETNDGGFFIAVDKVPYLTKVSSLGNFQNTVSFPSSALHISGDNSFQKTLDNNFVIVSDTTISGFSNIRLLKIRQNGSIIWDKIYTRQSADYSFAVYPTSDGGYVIAGHRSRGTYFDILVIKTDENGDTGQ